LEELSELPCLHGGLRSGGLRHGRVDRRPRSRDIRWSRGPESLHQTPCITDFLYARQDFPDSLHDAVNRVHPCPWERETTEAWDREIGFLSETTFLSDIAVVAAAETGLLDPVAR
jgi:hypothetical protein